MWLTRISIKNPYLATMLMLSLVVLGLFALRSLPLEEYPDVRFPIVIISTQYTGASPEVVESDVTRPLEESLNTISGIDNIKSYSFEGSSLISVEFELSVDPSVALQDVRDKISRVQGSLRREISTPSVSQIDFNDRPILNLSLSSNLVSSRDLTNWVNNTLKKRLQNVSGVGEVSVVGGSNREIKISIKPLRLEALGLSVSDVADAVKTANSDYPAGDIGSKSYEFSVRVSGKLKSVQDFADLIVAQRVNGAVHLSDIAEVTDGIAEKNSLAFYNGIPSLNVEIRATRGSNVVDVSNKVKAAVDALYKQMPAGTKTIIAYDKSEKIRTSLNSVSESLFYGAALAVLIVFLFLGSWRSTVITGLTLPVSLIGTFFALKAFGFTLNIMTLLALSLSIGLLIDDAIVVRENIVRHMSMGKTHYQAALDGTLEIGLAVFATTLAIIAVFIPVAFMGGIIGKFFHEFGLSITVAVLISMLVSFSLDPMLSSIWYDPHHHADHHKGYFGSIFDMFESSLDKLADYYHGVIEWSLEHRAIVISAAIAFTLFGFLLMFFFVGGEFIPRSDRGQFSITFKTAPGSSLLYTKEKAADLANIIRKDIPEIKSVLTTVGVGNFGAAYNSNKNQAELVIDVGDKSKRKRDLFSLLIIARKSAHKIAGIKIISVEETTKTGQGGKPINISLRGDNKYYLERSALKLEKQIAHISGVSDIESSLTDANPSLDIYVNREAASGLGVDLSKVGNTLSILLAGKVLTTWEAPDGDNYDVRMQVAKNHRVNDLLGLLTVAGHRDVSGVAKMIPLSALTVVNHSRAPSELDRINLQRSVTISANIDGRKKSLVFADIGRVLKKLDLTHGITLKQDDEQKFMAESAGYAVQALFIGVLFIYMILAAQFRSFTLPIIIMVSLPLSFGGVFISLFLFGSTLNMFSVIGIVMLMGLSAKNGILLVDFINQSRRNGMERKQAIIAAGRTRLRPIMMTTLAMVFGMLPLALGVGDGSETRAPMAHAIIGGLIASTVLTLLVVPVVYTLFDGISNWVLSIFRNKKAD